MAIDIDQSFYNTGTATVTNGGTLVTGQGTQWVSSIRANDIFGTHKGDGVRILSVESDTSLTLAYPWTGETQATAPYEVQFTPYDTGYYPAVRRLLQTLTSGNIEAFAALVGEPNRIPIFTGAGTMDLLDPSNLGIQDPNGSLASLAALTLGSQQILQTDASGALKTIALAANKALVTDANKDVQQIDLGTLGRALLALATGTNAQIVQADGAIINKSSLPVSTPTQTALDAKVNLTGGTLTGGVIAPRLTVVNTGSTWPVIAMHPFGTGDARRGELYTELSGTVNTVMRLTNPPLSQDVFFVFRSNGSMTVPGALSKGSGTFLTDHPLDPFNKNLRHGFVESTEYVNLYRGMVDLVDGRMIVDIDAAFGMTDGTFEALNADVMVSSLQNQYGPDRVWVEGPADSGKFTIICEDAESNATIAWMVTGRRNDTFVRSDLDPNTDSEGRFIPEFDKEDA